MSRPFSAAIYDPVDGELSADDRAFFKDVNPFGFILFQRHCTSPEAVKRLVGELKSLTGRDQLPVLIDQEGGRVARLVPPCWPKYPPAGIFAQLYQQDKAAARRAVYMNARLIAQDLYDLGITVNCAPPADVPVAGAHDVIGDRAFGVAPPQVIDLARAQADGLMDGGVLPVLKHIPGHGRATADSHEETPVVDASLEELRGSDFVPFAALKDLPMGMTAHVVFTALDKQYMATLSPTVITLIREEIGFDNLLLSDALDMQSMRDIPLDERARQALAAGCDIALHCNAPLEDKVALARGVGPLEGKALERAERAMASAGAPKSADYAAMRSELDSLLAAV